jgi:queuine tRNA-ribosyltransferase
MYRTLFQDHDARTGTLQTRSGIIETPFFMPVLTRGADHKVIGPEDYHRLGAEPWACAEGGITAAISNSLICAFAPGLDAVRAAGGLRAWLQAGVPLFTDSGGYQTSQGSSFVIERMDNGYLFRARWSGAEFRLTPQTSIELQQALASDVAMALDDMAPPGSDAAALEASVDRTHRWAQSALACRSDRAQLMFGICQGGTDPALRRHSARFIDALGFDGNAIGGVGVLPPGALRLAAVQASVGALSADRPRYVMGVGDPADIVQLIGCGIDCFDAAYPTIQAGRGKVITATGLLDIRRLVAAGIDSECDCAACRQVPITQLVNQPAAIAEPLIARHNLHFYSRLMADVRQAIRERRYSAFAESFGARWQAGPPSGAAAHGS